MSPAPAKLVPRGLAYLVDSALAFAFFATTQASILAPVRGWFGIDRAWFDAGLPTQLYTLVTVSFPVWLGFALIESSRRRATPGKRLLGLQVVGAGNTERVPFGKALLRTVVKLLPWELAHLTNHFPRPLWSLDEPEFRFGFIGVGWLMGTYVLWIALSGDGRGPHDRIAGTRVLHAAQPNRDERVT